MKGKLNRVAHFFQSNALREGCRTEGYVFDEATATIIWMQKHEKVPTVNFQLTPLLFQWLLSSF